MYREPQVIISIHYDTVAVVGIRYKYIRKIFMRTTWSGRRLYDGHEFLKYDLPVILKVLRKHGVSFKMGWSY